jgi:hypothetical protein
MRGPIGTIGPIGPSECEGRLPTYCKYRLTFDTTCGIIIL